MFLCICVFVYLCICVFVYLCICVFVYLCISVFACLCLRWSHRNKHKYPLKQNSLNMDLVSPFQVPSLIPLKYLVPSILTERETGLDTWSRLLSPTGDGISTLVPSFQTERGTGLDTWSRFFYLVHGPVSALQYSSPLWNHIKWKSFWRPWCHASIFAGCPLSN